MKTYILSENLQKKLPFLTRIISQRSQLPILLNFLLEVKNGKARISATDLEIGAQIEIPANVEKEGETTVPAKIFSELLGSLPQEKISLWQEENTLWVAGKKTKTSFQTIQANEFPKLYKEKGEEILETTGEQLKQMFGPVLFSASLDMGRPALSGVLIKKEENKSQLVATDGYRLSLKKTTLQTKLKKEEKEEVLIPARILREILAVAQEDKTVTLSLSKENNQVFFLQEDLVLVGRIIEAEFPNFEKIIPTDFSTQALFDREEMQKAVKICSIFARDAANIVRLSLKKDKIVVSANAPSVGENTVEVELKLEGEENEIAFNARYLLDLLGNLEDERLVFEMSGPLSPGVFKIEGDDSFLHLIMPIRVQAEQ